MKLKDVWATMPILVSSADTGGKKHKNYAEVVIEMGNDRANEHLIVAHYKEFLTPESREKLKQRIKTILDRLCVNPDDHHTPTADDATKTKYAHGLYDRLVQSLKSHKDDLNIRDGKGAWNIIPKPWIEKMEKAYRDNMPVLAQRCGVLFDTETPFAPQLLISDDRTIASVVPPSWQERLATGYAMQYDGGTFHPSACDLILIAHNGSQRGSFYERFAGQGAASARPSAALSPRLRKMVKPSEQQPIDILLPRLLGHELVHHLGLDVIASQHKAELGPKLTEDAAFTRRVHDDSKKAMDELATTRDVGHIIAVLEANGFLDPERNLAVLEAAIKDTPSKPEVRVGREFSLSQIKANASQLQEADRLYLGEALDKAVIMAAFAHSVTQIPAASAAAQFGTYDVGDEVLPTIMTLQSQLGVEPTRALFRNSYPPTERLMHTHGVDIAKSLQLTQIAHPPR